MKLASRILRHVLTLTGTVLLGGFFCATLVRFSPGFYVDEQQLDTRLSAESLQALRESHATEKNLLRFYALYLRQSAHGDLGRSHSLNQPVRTLLRDRLPVTFRLVAAGLVLGWAIALGLSMTTAVLRLKPLSLMAIMLSGTFLCIPAAVLALLSVLLNTPGYLALALIVFPKVFAYSRNLLMKAYSSPHVVTARAKGLGETRILLWHVLPVSAPLFLALAGVSVSVALGAAIPVEALCGIGGIGHLAWQAAVGRDLPLLVNITMLVTLVTLLASSLADVISYSAGYQES
jgi:peptide/nickel transport system permease protein